MIMINYDEFFFLYFVMLNYVDPKYESRDFDSLAFNSYVPRDERFDWSKKSEFTGNGIKSKLQDFLQTQQDYNPKELDSFEELDNMYHTDRPSSIFNPSGFVNALSRRENFPLPQVVKGIQT